MLKRFVLRRPSHGTVIAYLALFVALGGTAYAANEWTGRNIVNGSIKRVDLGANSVNGAKVANNSIKGADVLESSLVIGTAALKDGAVTPAKQAPVPTASVMRLSGETSSAAAGLTLHADYEFFDTAGLHEGASENLVAPVDGVYVVSATVEWDPNGTGYRRTSIVSNSGGAFASVAGPPLPAPAYTSQQVSGVERLLAGQVVRVEVLQGSGGNLNVRLARFQMTYVGGY